MKLQGDGNTHARSPMAIVIAKKRGIITKVTSNLIPAQLKASKRAKWIFT